MVELYIVLPIWRPIGSSGSCHMRGWEYCRLAVDAPYLKDQIVVVGLKFGQYARIILAGRVDLQGFG